MKTRNLEVRQQIQWGTGQIVHDTRFVHLCPLYPFTLAMDFPYPASVAELFCGGEATVQASVSSHML